MQMKKIAFFSIGILVSGALGLMLGKATYAVSSTEELIAQMFEEAELTETTSKDPKELENLASNEDAPFQNLYLFMFQNVSNGPTESALEELETRLKGKIRYEYKKDELREIVVYGNVTPILERHTYLAELANDEATMADQAEAQTAADEEMEAYMAENPGAQSVPDFMTWYYTEYARPDALTEEDKSSSVTHEQIFNEFMYLTELYEQELEFQRNYRKMGYEALATELFYNNDLNDSAGVDLLYDLDLAHMILFGEQITYPDRSGSDSIGLSSELVFGLPELEESEEVETVAVEEAVELDVEPDVELAEDTVNPYTCYDDSALQTALDAYYAEEVVDTAPETETGGVVYPYTDGEAEGSGEVDSGEADPVGDAKQEVDEALQKLDTFITQLQGTKGDWARSLPCGEVFCITVDLISETEDPTVEYVDTDNCIACHLSFINQRMSQTLDGGLVAGKVSMNWFEDATCKEAGAVNLDLNIFTVAMPIDLDPGDDIDEGPSKEIEDLKETLVSIGALSLPDGKTEIQKTLSDLECESILNIQDIGDTSATLQEVTAMCQASSARIQNTITTAVEASLFESQQSNATTLYEQVSAELSRMLLIFRNIQSGSDGEGGFKGTYLTGNAPLSSLANKKYCQQ